MSKSSVDRLSREFLHGGKVREINIILRCEMIGSLNKRRFWATDDNHEWAVFLFNSCSHDQIYIKYLFTNGDD